MHQKILYTLVGKANIIIFKISVIFIISSAAALSVVFESTS
jgi:hypothetical protein